MKEDFLHYIWLYRKFDFSNLTTRQGEPMLIIHPGNYLQTGGPDFFNAQIIIGEQKWAGNIEIHIQSSDWYLHQHEKDDNYNNVILHVVWQHDAPVFRKDNTEIPVLELRNYVAAEELRKYQDLIAPKSWIYCEKQISQLSGFVFSNWLERMFLERLERKSVFIQQLLDETENDWEAVLFCMLARNFGLNTNGEAFLAVAKSISFSIIRKESLEVSYLEALVFGQANLVPVHSEDTYAKELKSWYDYLVLKYKIKPIPPQPIQFFKHRPDNFPTIRLAQLCMLYHLHRNLFSKIIASETIENVYTLFEVSVSPYWKTHYTFEKISPKKNKILTKSFIDLIIINTVIPLKFAYNLHHGKDKVEQLIELISQLAPEKNAIIDKFALFGISSENAFESQALLQLKNEYCNQKKCLQCGIGLELIKNEYL